ncbi:uncharacterized protein [Temnothorax nylanderi]|uniref:uncharacterized protein isoform X1 n=1 Tax=Temnothorax nylanderi TaxID=102681 RepID=UPI003A8477DA
MHLSQNLHLSMQRLHDRSRFTMNQIQLRETSVVRSDAVVAVSREGRRRITSAGRRSGRDWGPRRPRSPGVPHRSRYSLCIGERVGSRNSGQRTLSYASEGTPCSFVNGRQGVPVRKERGASGPLAVRRRIEADRSQAQGAPTHRVKNIVMERIQSRSKKLCETLEKIYKPDSENLAVLKANEERLVKAYCAASVPYLKNIENIVNKFIAVPDIVLADEDKLQGVQYTEAEFECMRGKLEEFQQRAKRATILNAALKEELQLIEQSSICADNTDRMSHIIESGIACPDISDKIHQLVEDYKQFCAFFEDGAPVSQNSLYNRIDDLNCTDCDMDTL